MWINNSNLYIFNNFIKQQLRLLIYLTKIYLES